MIRIPLAIRGSLTRVLGSEAGVLWASHPDPLGIRRVLEAGTPSAVIETLGRLKTKTGFLAEEYAFSAPKEGRLKTPIAGMRGPGRPRNWYPTSVGQHHERVLAQSDRLVIPAGFDRGLFRLAVGLHDVGKRESITALETYAKFDHQKRFTLALVDHLRPQLPVENTAFLRLRTLISTSALGELFQDQISVTEAARRVMTGAHKAAMKPMDFLKVMTVYHQADAGAYTMFAGGPALLDKAFRIENGAAVFAENQGRLLYSAVNEAKLAQLERALRNFGQRKS